MLLLSAQDCFQLGVLLVAGIERLCVVELGQGDEGWFLGGVNHGEVVMGFGVAGLDLDRFAQRRLGGLALAKVVECRSEEMLGVGIFRIQLNGLGQIVTGLIKFFLPITKRADQRQGKGILVIVL